MSVTITDAIRQEHLDVESLFAKYQTDPEFQLAEKICAELESHADREEKFAYPTFCKVVPDATEHSYEEHNEARGLIARIKEAQDPDSQKALMTELRDAINHHVEEEETKVLPAVEKAVDTVQLKELGTKFLEAK